MDSGVDPLHSLSGFDHLQSPFSYSPNAVLDAFPTSELSPKCEALSPKASEPDAPRSESKAAVKVQKVYRSYRTCRRLADSAVVAEELWWQSKKKIKNLQALRTFSCTKQTER